MANAHPPADQRWLPFLKGLVIVLGVLIVIGLGVLVWGLTRLGGGERADAAPVPAIAADSPGAPAVWTAAIPAGASARTITAIGDGRFAVHVAGPQGEEILIVNRHLRIVEQRIRLRQDGTPAAD